jgi:hypothetical protein
MTKDDARFPDSKGWGFGKFNGIGLQPYGHTAAFNTTCFNCHKIADKNDYVFNLPPDPNFYDAGGLKVLSVFANRTRQTMSILYGNAAARQFVVKGDTAHAAGELYRLVTYRQTDNKYWYGSYINGPVLSVESWTPDANAESLARINELLSHQSAIFP